MAAPERSWRRVVLLAGDHRYDLAIPLNDTLDDVVRRLGLPLVPGRDVIVDATGRTTDSTARGEDLAEGSLLTVVEADAAPVAPVRRSRATPRGAERPTVWWLLVVLALVLAAVVLFDTGSGMLLPDVSVRILTGILLAGAAAASALLWVAHRVGDSPRAGLAMLAPLLLAFDGGAIIVPPLLPEAGHLAIAAGVLASAVVAGLLAVVLTAPRLRAGARAATVVLLVLALIWGVTLFAGAGPAAAAAISAGIVPLGLRALPATLLDVAEGYALDYRHFMSNRWTVRGVIPEDPGPVVMPDVRAEVAQSSARHLVAVVLLVAVPPLAVPLVLPGLASPDPFVFGGTIGLLTTVGLSLVLHPRSAAHPVLRWAPRVSAALVLAEVATVVALAGPPLILTLAAALLLALALLAGILVVPIARGASSLVWSRMADATEWLAVALAPAAALLAADALDLVRGMMAA